ncbi:MAG TPA: glycoside hydrolase family 2 TIM barrel-domain containing protein [Clostridia bacterium]|nr:glycoside hydrolase family 2 protein [Clostridiaceae bacterium]HOF27043.1 glycoside hydrolase family 2 TIM barrel-domain containing protein [Clostridia bacterium]HOM34349.1 glycoside hydrolase family 2 TIM barrel-domain containing protein [Clostridia bacterium]HOR89345.1 glycoside hydrolase family 2 TIM barrel-domain containing protein [Clostridia bacterium]HOT70539.1 glycoside hydrolase family 2 TIM barrel-domain containing protein [Clostridia bacterium]
MRTIYNLNAKWAFTKQANAVPKELPDNWIWVNLPHTWNGIDGQDGGNDYYRNTCYYAKQIDKTDLPTTDCYYLEIQGANSSADVYLNGKHLAHHDGGYSTWRADITPHLTRDNLLVVAVDNSHNEKVYPQFADFTFYGGLYRDVNLVCVNKSHFSLDYYGGPGVKITPKIAGKDAEVHIETWVTNHKEGQSIRYTIYDAEDKKVTESETDKTEAMLEIKNVHLWHGRKDPYLYKAEVELIEDGKVIDNISSRFGCRTFEIHPENGFILNGEQYPLRGVCRHQDRLDIGNALLPEHHDEDMQLICETGSTTIRLAHYQHDQYFYDLCDEYGMVVWAEIPYISQHNPAANENTISQMKELVIQNYNHPSIVVWGLSNEITMKGDRDPDLLRNHQILNDLCHELDSTRLTTVAAVSPCPVDSPYLKIPDVVSYNHYFGWYGGDVSMNGPWFDDFHKKHPDIPIGCSEYGCEALNWHTSRPDQGDYTEEYQAYYHEELIKQLFSRKYLWATHVWNMFDFGADARNEGGTNGRNHKGLVTIDRKYKKDSFYAYKAYLSDEPFVHICGKRYINRVEDMTKVTVYSNQPEVELLANGVSLGKKKAKCFFYFDVPNKGRTVLTAVAGKQKDESVINKVEKFDESYRMREKTAILNWFDITAPEGYFSLNDKIEDILKTTRGTLLFMGLFGKMIPKKGEKVMGGFEMNDSMMKMLGGFTVLRLAGMVGTMGLKLTKEDLLDLNAKLNKIKKKE